MTDETLEETTEADEPVGIRCSVGSRRDDVERRMPPHACEAEGNRELEAREPLARDQERPAHRNLREERLERCKTPADDHEASRSRANVTNASATRVRARPDADASEIWRVASRPSTRASPRRPAVSSASTAVREMNVTP